MSQKTVYFAGALFSTKEILGNALMGDAIERVSNDRYKVFLPQTKVEPVGPNISIRNTDFYHLLSSDVAIFNFDGTDLDSGTVVEFCYAKVTDTPAVLLRTDFRSGGDQELEPWNLMCSGFPRCKTLLINSMMNWHNCLDKSQNLNEIIKDYVHEQAVKIVEALDEVTGRQSLFKGDESKAELIYKWAVESCGDNLNAYLTDAKLKEIVKSKKSKGII